MKELFSFCVNYACLVLLRHVKSVTLLMFAAGENNCH